MRRVGALCAPPAGAGRPEMKSPHESGVSGLERDTVINPLILDLLDWLAAGPRAYADLMEVWRTSCPRLTIWEDAVALGLVARVYEKAAGGPVVILTTAGRRRREGPSRT